MNILITGANDGIGRQVALELAHRKEHVYVTTHTLKQAENWKEKYQNKYPNITCFQLDVTNPKDREKVRNLDIDILILNAAIGEGGSICEIPMNLVRKNFEVNVFSNFELLQQVLPTILQKKKGRIIVTSSLLGKLPFPFLGVYGATKASISMLTSTLALELKELPYTISISIIEPGAYYTEFNQLMLENKYPWMSKKSIFKNKLKSIYRKERIKFSLLEKKHLSSIVPCYLHAIYDKRPKRIYRAPFFQSLCTKIYLLFH